MIMRSKGKERAEEPRAGYPEGRPTLSTVCTVGPLSLCMHISEAIRIEAHHRLFADLLADLGHEPLAFTESPVWGETGSLAASPSTSYAQI